ncbi:YkoF family thiamine/hydroxymethylpyrimidine-binding protein [Pontibacillus litoralis]|uniref:HMP/thiamine-binding protein ykoF n=1 Tax=Pontibacillus litoralis JSM 072002 TaxID=1385512 RepID=A0A0A5G7M9_9BACI|nr:YkoF family thiamine/hydroxymethylpyrimidine-binding protein [Pontibacillus litoralis]KGX87188.1 HMP/thiamine-binding protein ykoF [Pontibacillus litoralis JSM 072002]
MKERNCTSTRRVARCSFALYPMTDRFVDIITEALTSVDTTNVEMKTDDLGTYVEGAIQHVFDVTKALFLQAANTGHHVIFSGTFSIGCPGHAPQAVSASTNDACLNKETSKQIEQEVAARFALYPLGVSDYMHIIYEQIELLNGQDMPITSSNGTRFDGDGRQLFRALELIFTQVELNHGTHTILTTTISANSPSPKGE